MRADLVELLYRGVNTNEPPDKTDEIMSRAADEIKQLRGALDQKEPNVRKQVKKYTRISPVAIEEFPDAHNVFLQVESQRFCVTPHACDSRAEAEWMRNMLCAALTKMVQEIVGPKPQVEHSAEADMHEWRPIETAPKDRMVIGAEWCPEQGGLDWRFFMTWWAKDGWVGRPTHWVSAELLPPAPAQPPMI